MSLGKPYRWWSGKSRHAADLWSDCMLYYAIWAGQGGKLYDLSVRGYDGTLTQMDPPTDWVPTEYGMALDFDGSNDYVDTGSDDLGLSTADDFSIFAFFKTSHDYTAEQGYIACDYGSPGWYLNVSQTNLLEIANFSTPSKSEIQPSNSVVNDGLWHSAVGTINGSAGSEVKPKLYLDGVQQTAASTKVGAPSGLGIWLFATARVGRRGSTASRYFRGQLLHLIIWKRILSLNQIARLSADPFCMIRPRTFAPYWAGISAAGVTLQERHYPRGVLRGVCRGAA